MGERGARNEAATAEDVRQMAGIVGDAVAAGAVGFSTSRILGHQTLDGKPIPGTFASEDELFAIGRALSGSGAVFQLVPGGSVGSAGQKWKGEQTLAYEIEWMSRLSREARIPVTFLIVEHTDDPNAWKEAFRLTEIANSSGARLYPQTGARPAGFLTSFQGVHIFARRPTYMKLAHLPLSERAKALRTSEIRRAILAEENVPALSGSLKDDWHNIITTMLPSNVYALGSAPNYEPGYDELVGTIAQQRGASAEEAAYDLMLERDGTGVLVVPMMNYASGDLSAIHDMLTHPASIVGLADGGAHCTTICDASSTTSLLTHWVRDRTRGPRMSLEHVIRKQTFETAALYGMTDRGLIRPGMRADLNVIDFDRLELGAPYAVNDLPAGGLRFLQKAKGYGATIVRGVVTRRDDTDTGARPGRLVRGGPRPAALAAE
jgi:N-acyl-D-aspartate/D-glutamate deacylase